MKNGVERHQPYKLLLIKMFIGVFMSGATAYADVGVDCYNNGVAGLYPTCSVNGIQMDSQSIIVGVACHDNEMNPYTPISFAIYCNQYQASTSGTTTFTLSSYSAYSSNMTMMVNSSNLSYLNSAVQIANIQCGGSASPSTYMTFDPSCGPQPGGVTAASVWSGESISSGGILQ